MLNILTLRILDSRFVAGTKDIVHHVQILQNGDVSLRWMDAVKKLLCAGQRGHKGRLQDLTEALAAVQRAIDATILEGP